ncbi:putative signal transduction histidine kinase [Emticicia oligotrophica DSM 17448]|uniref:Signal transduction histidine kinase n=2 Tax=Emticicia TaxID=312278 RepID=A0ABM5MYA2_EMTOG|nr:histidine kinase [Emticicia oligotrophica]AFK02076.1 putative signal transduction histidine kinase [Emticicia oligotrophica DSM 17448]
MMMNKIFSTKQFVWGVSLFLALFVNLPIIFLQLPRLEKSGIAQLDILIQVLVCLIYSVFFIQLVYRSMKNNLGKSRIILELIVLFIGFVVLLTSLNVLIIGLSMKMFPTVVMRGGVIGIIAYFFSRFLIEAERKNEILLENELLRNENLMVQLTSLKNQLNPHFLFNSLNTLSWLINEDKAKSQRYLQKLSQVLRYSLSMQEQSLVALNEELTLIESYIFLLQMRFGDNLIVNKNIDDVSAFKIPPLSLQLLVENAIKHNIISMTSPLKIIIEANLENETLTVRNSLNSKPNSEGTGIGLANLNERFRILADKGLEIDQTEKEFIVTLPLIN